VSREVRSPAVGRVIEVLVHPGDVVSVGQEVAIVESMKVEIPVVAETAGVVERVAVDPGTQVQSGGLLLILSS
jgi:acetyl-CoA carboxylase biotin carboxyl carrier protein